jgi:hypothetical protein
VNFRLETEHRRCLLLIGPSPSSIHTLIAHPLTI